MKTYIFILYIFTILFFSLYSESNSGQIYGTIEPSSGGLRIDIICANQLITGKTNNDGSYSIYVPNQGQCAFIFYSRMGVVQTPIYSYTQPVKYDFVIVYQNNNYILLRK